MTKAEKTTVAAEHEAADAITADELDRMNQVFEQAKRVVKPIVKRESAAEVVSAELLNIRLKDAHRT